MTPIERVKNTIVDILKLYNSTVPEDPFEQVSLCLEVLEKNQAPKRMIEIVTIYQDILYEELLE